MSEITTDSLLVLERRGRGRPRVEEPRSTVSTWIFSKHHDALVQMAREREVSVSALVSQILEKALVLREK